MEEAIARRSSGRAVGGRCRGGAGAVLTVVWPRHAPGCNQGQWVHVATDAPAAPAPPPPSPPRRCRPRERRRLPPPTPPTRTRMAPLPRPHNAITSREKCRAKGTCAVQLVTDGQQDACRLGAGSICTHSLTTRSFPGALASRRPSNRLATGCSTGKRQARATGCASAVS